MLSMILGGAAFAQSGPFSFEGLPDSTILTNQLTGATFANAIILSMGITLNEFEFPPHGGSNVASDNGGPMTIVFAAPLRGFSGYFTHNVQVTLLALDSANNVLATMTSAFPNNEALSGTSGSHPNELLEVSSSTGIFKVVITGSSQGTSFTLDDAALYTRCDLTLDGVTNVADAQAILNQALGAAKAVDDLTLDGVVNVVDAQIVINAALGSVCEAK
jgi:hypothetical protein